MRNDDERLRDSKASIKFAFKIWNNQTKLEQL